MLRFGEMVIRKIAYLSAELTNDNSTEVDNFSGYLKYLKSRKHNLRKIEELILLFILHWLWFMSHDFIFLYKT